MQPHFASPQAVFAFGRFNLYPALRRLECDGEAVKIGARAFDLLHLLLENAGETVAKRVIWDRVWPGLHVSEGNLRFQLVELRRVLAAGDAGGSIASVPGRGYCFASPLKLPASPVAVLAAPGAAHLPPRPDCMVGRRQALLTLQALLDRQRLVTIVGAGGIGKTTLATFAAYDRLHDVECEIAFVDIGAILDSALVASAVAASLGLAVQSSDPIRDIAARLQARRTLLILDSCEHVLDSVAILAERLLAEAPLLYLLVTSREALRIQGEHVLLLEPFDEPSPEQATSLSNLIGNAAAQLLIERARAADSQLQFTDEDAPSIAALCRQLDGVALAIELAAGRIRTHGLRGTMELLAGRLDHLRGGKRTAPARHASLRQTLAWSYDLLAPEAQLVLRRLSIFVGPFSLAAACAVASDSKLEPAFVSITLDDLVAKSLVAVRRCSDTARFRLLDTTRHYLQEQISRDEWPVLAARHAAYYTASLRQTSCVRADISPTQTPSLEDLPNIRAALNWCYPQPGINRDGTALAAGAAILLQRLSLLAECQDVCRTAVAALLPDEIGSRDELELQTCLAQSLMYKTGHGPEVLMAFERALALAARFGEVRRQLTINSALHVYHNRSADFAQGLVVAERGYRVVREQADLTAAALGHISLGIALHHVGRHHEASHHLDQAIALGEQDSGVDRIAAYATHPNRARVIVAQSLWLRGYPERAAEVAQLCIEEASALDHALSLAVALSGVPPVFIWRGDWDEVERLLDLHWTLAEQNSLHPYRALVVGRRGEVAIHKGYADVGVPLLEAALTQLRDLNYKLFSTPLQMSLAEGLAQLGRTSEALALIEACLAAVERGGDALYLPELLRLKADIAERISDCEINARILLRRALATARDQGALAWELRAACSLTRIEQGGPGEAAAKVLLSDTLGRFGERGQSSDFRQAQMLLGPRLYAVRTRRASLAFPVS